MSKSEKAAPAYDIDALKAQHGDTLFANTVTLPDEMGGEAVEIVWKPPNQGNYAMYTQAADKRGPQIANRLLLLAVAVHPDPKTLAQWASAAPVAVFQFLEDAGVTRYFGQGTEVGETRAL